MKKKPFKSDGCSMWPDGPWRNCCVKHDKHYWQGGSAGIRFWADQMLMRCVYYNGHPIIAIVMFIGVRIFGHPVWPVPWRWDFGKSYNWGRYG